MTGLIERQCGVTWVCMNKWPVVERAAKFV